jgi:hypothetical protein
MEVVDMLYFRFNTDNFVTPKQECTVTEYKDGKPTSFPQRKVCEIDFGQVQSFFFKKLSDELSLSDVGMGSALYDVIGIPMDAFSINDEVIGNFDGSIKFILSEYAKLPISQLDDKSLNDLGITIEFCKRGSNNEINSKIRSYMQTNNLKYLAEDVLWKNMTNEEKISKFLEHLTEIGTEGNELIIVDPYIFNCEQDEYCEILASILNQSKAKSVIIVTDKNSYKKFCYDKLSNKINIVLTVNYSNNFHDRFWIANRTTGFYTGTSFNGVGKKISLINTLCDDDVADIIDELCKQSLII